METPQTLKPWSVTPEKVEAAIRRIVEVGQPLKIILFGSYVRGTTGVNSDLDVIVVAPDDVGNPRKESVRIRRTLRDIGMPMDIIVVARSQWERLKETPGTIFREAWKAGKVVHES